MKLIRSSLSICSFNKTVQGMYTTHKHYKLVPGVDPASTDDYETATHPCMYVCMYICLYICMSVRTVYKRVYTQDSLLSACLNANLLCSCIHFPLVLSHYLLQWVLVGRVDHNALRHLQDEGCHHLYGLPTSQPVYVRTYIRTSPHKREGQHAQWMDTVLACLSWWCTVL